MEATGTQTHIGGIIGVPTQTEWRIGSARHIANLVDMEFTVLEGYARQESVDAMLFGPDYKEHAPIRGIPNYNLIQKAYDNLDTHFRYLGVLQIPEAERQKLLDRSIKLSEACEKTRAELMERVE